MAHLVTDTVVDFLEAGLVQHIVVDVDPSRTEKAANVCAYLGGLFGSIDLVKLVDVDTVGTRHFEDRDGNLWIIDGRVGVEERCYIDRSDHDEDDLKSDGENAAPYVPSVRLPANHRIQCCNGNTTEDQNNKRTDQLVTKPRSESLVGLVVDVIPVEANIYAPWETEDRICKNRFERRLVRDRALQGVDVVESALVQPLWPRRRR